MRFSYQFNPAMSVCPHEFVVIPRTVTNDQANAGIKECLAWCKETFPESREIRFYYSGWTVWLVRERDAFEFRMRWC